MKCTYVKHIRILWVALALTVTRPAYASDVPRSVYASDVPRPAYASDVPQSTSPWETVSSAASADASEAPVYEASVRNGYVYVTVSKPLTVKVYTILGQLVSQQTVPAGTSRLRLQVRGIYILKMGEVTRRINV